LSGTGIVGITKANHTFITSERMKIGFIFIKIKIIIDFMIPCNLAVVFQINHVKAEHILGIAN